MLLAGWANWPEMASVRVARLDPETVVVWLEVAVAVARLDNSGLAVDAAVDVVVDGAVAAVVATISASVSGAWLEVARMVAVSASTAVTVAVLEEAAAEAMLELSLVAASLLDKKAMEAEMADSSASHFSVVSNTSYWT